MDASNFTSRAAALAVILIALVAGISFLLTRDTRTVAPAEDQPEPVEDRVAHSEGLPQPSREPDYVPPKTTSPRLATFVNREAKEPRVTGDITTRIPKVTDVKDIEAMSTVLADTKDDDTVRNEAANLLRRSGHPQLTDELITVLSNPEEKERFRTFCVQHLYNNYKKAGPTEHVRIAATLRKCLADQHVKVRREALLALHRLKDDDTEAIARKWLHEDGENGDAVRDLVIRIIRERNLRDELPTIRKYARDKNVVIRIAALVTLSEWRDEESRPLMEEAAKSDRVRLQRCGKLALKRLDEPLPTPKSEPASEPPAKAPEHKEIDGF